MKGTLEFDISDPSEADAMQHALDGAKWRACTLHALDDIRKVIKYSELTEDQTKLVENLRDELISWIEHFKLSINE